jgi:hypothetical protein
MSLAKSEAALMILFWVGSLGCGNAESRSVKQRAPAMSSASNGPNPVIVWSANANAVTTVGRPPGSSEYLLALAHLAIWDAVVAIEGGFQPYASAPAVMEPASIDAAIAAAAYNLLRIRVPSQAANLQAQYDAFLAGIPDGSEKTNGIAVGEAAARGILDARAHDGFDNVVPYEQPAPGPGVFEPVLPSEPVDVKLKQVQPLVDRLPAELRPKGPRLLTSHRYARDFNEVKRRGRADSTDRTPEETETARFWSEKADLQLARSLRELAVENGLDVLQAARLLAIAHLSAGDAVLAGFEAKYHFLFWRPVHAIHRADPTINRRTEPDPTWSSFLVVNHPEYPSGHSFYSGAVLDAVRAYFGSDEVPWTISSTVTNTSRHYTTLREIKRDITEARILSGLHFRASMDDGFRLGSAAASMARCRLPIAGSSPEDCSRREASEDLEVEIDSRDLAR